MDRTTAQWRFREGDDVIRAGEKKLGKVIAFFPDMTMPSHLVVHGGMLFHQEFWVPVSAMSNYDGQHIDVNVTKDEASNRGWDRRPDVRKETAMGVTAGMVVDPVCGMPVNPSEAPAQSRYQGKTYSFCSRECKQMFDAQPERYVTASQAMPPAEPEQPEPFR